jgi:hypothetical protein
LAYKKQRLSWFWKQGRGKMNRIIALTTALFLLAGSAFAQTVAELYEGSNLAFDNATGAFTFSWWGRAGRTYLIMTSDDMIHWNYVPIIEVGADQTIEWGFTSTGNKFFLKLRHTATPDGDPYNVDLNGNGMADNWELQYFGAFGQSASADPDGDGRSNLTEYLMGTNPTVANGEVGPAFVQTELQVYTPLE